MDDTRQVLSDYHNRLSQRFRQIADTRQGNPVFLLEHGMPSDERKCLTESLQRVFRLFDGSVDVKFGSCYLPFLVIATEIGYDYTGNEKVFWPKLENELQCDVFTLTERQTISDWHEKANILFRAARPPETTWAKQFRHIAWPITNSVLPKDIRLPLMESLRAIPSNYYLDSAPDLIARFLRDRTDGTPRRYQYWLNGPLIGRIALSLISDDDSSDFLTLETLNRIRDDMKRDENIVSKLKGLKDRINEDKSSKLTIRLTSSSSSGNRLTSRIGRLFLIRDMKGNWAFEGQLPESVVGELYEDDDFRTKLRHGSWRANGWNCVPIPPGVFLSQERFLIDPSHWRKIDSPFIDPGPVFPGKTSELLESIRFRLNLPVLFEPLSHDENPEKEEYRRIPAIIPNTKTVVCIVDDDDAPEDTVDGIIIDENSPDDYFVLHLDTSNPAALDWAKNLGIRVLDRQFWKWIVPFGSVEEDEKRLMIAEGTAFFLEAQSDRTIRIDLGNETAELKSGMISFDGLSKDDDRITIYSDTTTETWKIDVIPKQKFLFDAKLHGEPNVDSLRDRSLSVTVDSLHPFINVRYTLTLVGNDNDGESVSCSGRWDAMPGVISRNAFFVDAFDESNSELGNGFWGLVRSEQDLKLLLNIEGVYRNEWFLESTNPGVWWEDTNMGEPVACSDGDEIETEEILHKTGRLPLYSEEYRLFRAVDQQGPIARATTIFQCPNVFGGGKRAINLPPRVLRQAEDKKNGVGLGNIIDDIIAFRQARAEGLLSELVRRQILDTLRTTFWTICCGEEWVKKSEELDRIDIAASLGGCLISLVRKKLNWGTRSASHDRKGVSEKLLSDDLINIHEIVENVLQIYPDLGLTLHHAIGPSVEKELSGMIFAVIESVLKEKTGWEGLNGYINEDAWNACFTDFTDTIHGRELAGMIYPHAVGDELFMDFHSDWSLKETTAYFERHQKTLLIRSPYRDLWNTNILKNVFSIFMKPEAFDPHAKKETLRALLLDRQSTRGIAFVCWRRIQQEKINEFFSIPSGGRDV